MSNPFLSLFASSEEATSRVDSSKKERRDVGDMLMRIFLFTVSEESASGNTPQCLVFLPQLARDEEHREKTAELDVDNIVQGLAERLQMATPAANLRVYPSGLSRELFSKERAIESSGFLYLADCYARAIAEQRSSKPGDEVIVVGDRGLVFVAMMHSQLSELQSQVVRISKEKIIEMAGPLVITAHSVALLQEPGSRAGSDFVNLLLLTVNGSSSVPLELFSGIAESQAQDLLKLNSIFAPVLDHVFNGCQDLTLSNSKLGTYFSILEIFASSAPLAKVLVNSPHWLPRVRIGKSFESHTLIGRLLRPSSVSPSLHQPSEQFSHLRDLYQAEVDSTTASVQAQLEFISQRMHKVLDGLLRVSPESKKALISWLVECFERNGDRAKMMSRLDPGSLMTASDGFFLSLSWVMLRLSSPFMGGKKSRISTVDPSYCTVSKELVPSVDPGGPLVDFTGEAKMVPAATQESGAESASSGAPFNFVTHCFFLTHKCLILGMTQVLHRFEDIMRAYVRVRESLVSIRGGGGEGSVIFQRTQQRFRLIQSQLLGLKAHAMHPQLLELCLSFYTTTAQWLVQLVAKGSQDISSLSPLPDMPPLQLQMVPECLVENVANFAMFLRQSQADTLTNATHQMHHLVTFVTVFMGSSKFIRNPHIRAKLAHLLSLMTPKENNSSGGLVPNFSESQKNLFDSHELASKQLIEALMSIFIDIEHTGESMEFEDKFQYRIPMYEVLEFLWGLPSYRPCIEALGQQAVLSHEYLEAPVFLRFINMMINDTTVQLDEGLDNLVKVKEIEDVISSEEWQSFSDERKKEYQQQLSEASMMARNRNHLANNSVHALQFMTADLTKAFVVPTMVGRIAAMLNYVLVQLVGPRSKELKVKNAAKYHFKPGELVSGIITVYLNLGKEQRFCEALPRDGRSFSMDLFSQAEKVLRILSRGDLIGELQVLADRVRQCQLQFLQEEEAFEEAPEEFLDPVTSELMRDPVILPTSGTTMDRANIIRHLLSDLWDPFNRAPLTAEMLQPNDELKQRIEEWKKSRDVQK